MPWHDPEIFGAATFAAALWAPTSEANLRKRRGATDATNKGTGEVIDLFRTGKDVKVSALAGSGKTKKLLRMICEATRTQGTYMALRV